MTQQRQVPTRRVALQYPEGDLPRHFAGDMVRSHVAAVLSSLFPPGEEFFMRSVRRYRKDIADPELKKQVAGFLGQEVMHDREHRRFNDRLASLGYPTHLIERRTDAFLRFLERVLSPQDCLAITAALEHYTATLAELLMSTPEARDVFVSEEVRNLFLWHALEESEHKAVAFDVYQAVDGSYLRRALVMDLVTIGFLTALVLGLVQSLARDPAARNLRELVRSLAEFRRSPFLARSVVHRLRTYNRRGFHPDDWDATELQSEWRERLFGDSGVLKGRLEGAAA